MKKFLRNVIWRSLCILVFGVLLVVFAGDMSRWIVYASGGLFVVLATIVLVGYFRNRKVKGQSVIYPMVALGCALFGVVQLLFPDLFFGTLRYLLSGIMALLALFQLYSLVAIKRSGIGFHWGCFLLPLVGISAAAFVIFYDGFVENDPQMMFILGVMFFLYAILEIWTVLLVKKAAMVDHADANAEVKKLEN